jgi:hypothetical protein
MALGLARAYSQQFLTAGIAAQLAHEDRVQAKAAFFPTLNAFNQYIYTQGNGTPSGVSGFPGVPHALPDPWRDRRIRAVQSVRSDRGARPRGRAPTAHRKRMA